MYALYIQSKEVKDAQGYVYTVDNTWFLILKDEWGDTGVAVEGVGSLAFTFVYSWKALRTFNTIDAARDYAAAFKGHPWYCSPNGTFEVVEVMPTFREQTGWAVKVNTDDNAAAQALRGATLPAPETD